MLQTLQNIRGTKRLALLENAAQIAAMRFADPIRQTLADEIARQRTSCIALSRRIGRNDSFVAQFLVGRMKKLGERDRLHLAMALGIDEVLLGARMPWRPAGELGSLVHTATGSARPSHPASAGRRVAPGEADRSVT